MRRDLSAAGALGLATGQTQMIEVATVDARGSIIASAAFRSAWPSAFVRQASLVSARFEARVRLHVQQREQRPPKGAIAHEGGTAEDASFPKVHYSRNELRRAPEGDSQRQCRPGIPIAHVMQACSIVVVPKPISPTTAGLAHHSLYIPASVTSGIFLHPSPFSGFCDAFKADAFNRSLLSLHRILPIHGNAAVVG